MRVLKGELFLLFGGYLNLDWDEDYESAEEAIRDFLHSAPPATVQAVIEGIRTLLESDASESELETIMLHDLNTGYFAPGDGATWHAWLTHVLQLLRPQDPRP